MNMCSKTCFHLHKFVVREWKVSNAPAQSSFCEQLAVDVQCPVASQWAVLSVIPAPEPDSHHKGPIVSTGRIGSQSARHSAATCMSRRHSGACFLFLGLCTQAGSVLSLGSFTLIWEVYPSLLLSSSQGPVDLLGNNCGDML
ncbi:hypothetical protein GOODEAATRI_000472 [Goodea atripinnis]|uniref:Uncharacterized protein n=1 Tax=Goodea atripinnis TaxID=208336 RepID=A0ABV0MPF8_9TELE